MTLKLAPACQPINRFRLNGPENDGIARKMLLRYVVQRDLDGTWSVRETATNSPVTVRGSALVGLSEKMAASRARKLNSRIIDVDEQEETTPKQ
jgi:hypothetical protein